MRPNAHWARLSNPPRRRGNSIVLVMGILVLLVIIATAFITRTQAGRVTSNAMQRTMLRDDNARAVAGMFADQISAALFPYPIGPTFGGPGQPASSNAPRLSQRPLDLNGDGIFDYFPIRYAKDPIVPYNFAPYYVVPYTNWPDGFQDLLWPVGPGNPGPVVFPLGSPLIFEGNPVGNPGFGDTRWLADHEPLRWAIGPGPDLVFGTPDDVQAFSHWRHMANIAHPNNGFRICKDISDLTNVNGFGGIVDDLSIPVEQWLAISPFNLNIGTGDSYYPGATYIDQWFNWFSPSYTTMYVNNAVAGPMNVPANFYNLSDLNANDVPLEPGERPQDEFINGTDRWNVNRVLADTDGDGFTDSFWYLAPTMTERGIRQIVAVRIVDNSAMLDVNVATRFNRVNSTGATPSDLALVGELSPSPPPGNYNVGIFDNPAHHESTVFTLYGDTNIGYNPEIWDTGNVSYLGELGVLGNPFFPLNLGTADERRRYWSASGRDPLGPSLALTPFTFTEELELRMYNGQNYPWIASRFEKAVQSNVFNSLGSFQFLHANLGREEANEYLEQLNNVELAFDHRHNLTMYSGARNDEMPPWLWWRWDIPQDVQQDADAFPNEPIIDRFLAQARTKLDLRHPGPGLGPPLLPGLRNFRDRLAPTLLLALIDGDGNKGSSYFGGYDIGDEGNLDLARLAAAGLSANIREWRDDDSDLKLVDAEPLPKLNSIGPVGDDIRMLGMERQPFLVEALIAHVHEGKEALTSHLGPPGPTIAPGDNVMCSDAPGSTVVVVQIANPFDSVLDLSTFQLSVFGNPVPLSGTLASSARRTYYAIEDDFEGADLDGEWIQLLNLQAEDVVNVTGTWSTDRSDYDTGDEEQAIELVRMIPPVGVGSNVPVVVDRIDIKAPASQEDFEFGEKVENMQSALPNADCPEPPMDAPWDVFNLDTDTHWIQWVHVTRAWDVDFNGSLGFQADESNPRYVFSIREVDDTAADGDGYSGVVPGTIDTTFNLRDKGFAANGDLNFSMQMLQKDDDFEQVGEVLNVWMFGHELKFAAGVYELTNQTFSEFMIDDDLTNNNDPLVNRLRIEPDVATLGQVVGLVNLPDPPDPLDPTDLLNPLHAVPAVPAGARVLDAFVCDDRGVNGTAGVDEFLNANGFSGKITPGLINVNTAGERVLRSAPHMAKLVHEIGSPSLNPSVRVPEATIRYRERFGDPANMADLLPDYGDRGDATFIDGLRGDRGIASLGELMLMLRPAVSDPNDNWRIDFAGQDPFATGESVQISTDLNDLPGNNPDLVAKDAEELNLLYAGMSNMLTTRSDVFTVYFRVRSFIQNPTTRVWDATDPEFIVDDSRYVMLVDRSEVNHPSDKPKILYMEKLPK